MDCAQVKKIPYNIEHERKVMAAEIMKRTHGKDNIWIINNSQKNKLSDELYRANKNQAERTWAVNKPSSLCVGC